MAVWIALLRGVNVGGAGKLPMAGFRALLSDLGLGQVRTHIQSGNAVLDSDLEPELLERMIQEAVARTYGFAPETFVRSPHEVAAALADQPFAAADPARVLVFFLRDTPALDEGVLKALARPGEAWQTGPRRFILHAPGGIGRSRLAERLPRLLPGPTTARNLRSLRALVDLAE